MMVPHYVKNCRNCSLVMVVDRLPTNTMRFCFSECNDSELLSK